MTPSKVSSRLGRVSVQMTAQDIISLAVNVAQNGWSEDERVVESAVNAPALQEMLAEVYDCILKTNRLAASRRRNS